MKYNIVVIEGDGIGLDIVIEVIKVLNIVGEKFNYKFEYEYVLMGGCVIDKEGILFLEVILDVCKKSDVVLFGVVGGFKWDDFVLKVRLE